MEIYLPLLRCKEVADRGTRYQGTFLFWQFHFSVNAKNSKVRPYTTKNGVSHLFDTYADDLTIYLQRHSYNEKKNLENVNKALEIMEMFFVWSVLKID